MVEMVCIDLDGTLLDKTGQVSKNTKEVIKKAVENGVHIVLASRKT